MTRHLLSWYANSALLFWWLLSAALVIFNLLHIELYLHSPSSLILRFVVPAGLSAASFWMLGRTLRTRLVIANMAYAVIVSLYLSEAYLQHRLKSDMIAAAERSGQVVDDRSKLEVIKALREAGTDANPVMRAKSMLVLDPDGIPRPVLMVAGRPLLPLASVPNKVVVSCNESGQWLTYRADRHGFNNPDEVWDSSPIQIGLLGDSFVHGSCVSPDRNIAANLRQDFPGVLSLGVSGFGPLSQLAALTEYLAPLQPPLVLWFFFEGNDLTEDLPFEMRTPFLRRYLEDNDFSQNLIDRITGITPLFQDYLDARLTEAMQRVDNPYENLIKTVSLFHVREVLGLGPTRIGYVQGSVPDAINSFASILEVAKKRIERWGGRLVMVYLPESDRYFSMTRDTGIYEMLHQGVVSASRGLDIPVIDISIAFGQALHPERLYAYPGAHCSVAGYRLIADTIRAALPTFGAPVLRSRKNG